MLDAFDFKLHQAALFHLVLETAPDKVKKEVPKRTFWLVVY